MFRGRVGWAAAARVGLVLSRVQRRIEESPDFTELGDC
ncbi:hypothetical protein MMSP_2886 [Mycobacterium sp. 012931]|nr:hypothetical protein MMSP_2886 [Mycobacterium sp. 012931]